MPHGPKPNPCREAAALSRPAQGGDANDSDVVEGALVQEADRCEELSSEQRAALADKLGAIAKRHLSACARACGAGAEGVAPRLAPAGRSQKNSRPTCAPARRIKAVQHDFDKGRSLRRIAQVLRLAPRPRRPLYLSVTHTDPQ